MARSSADIAAVKSRLDLVDVVRRYVDLRPAAGRFVGLCPFHQEKTPSFSVNPDQGFFYCFGCQAGGDVIDFYSRINGLEFREALEALAEQAGVRLEGLGAAEDPAEARRRNVRKSCLAMHELAQGYFRHMLAAPAGRVAREYLQRRQLDPEVVERFGLGYAADDWQGLHNALRDAGYAPDLGVEAGLLSRGAHERGGRVYDRFRGRLIFPIQDMAGRVIAFGGRILADSKDDGAPKYLNSSDTPIYTKGEHLYGLSQARAAMARSRRALLTEGYVDVLALQQHGFGEAVGVLGTALTENQVRRLGQLVSEVELVFDGDAAGRKAALRSAPMVLAQGLKCRVILLPDGLDADDILRQHGRSAFEALLDQAPEGLCFCMDTLRHGAAPKDMLEFTRSFMRSLREPALGAYFLPRLAEGLGLAEAELRQALRGVSDGPGNGARGAVETTRPAVTGRERRRAVESGSFRDRELLGVAIRHPELRAELAQLGFEALLGHERSKALWCKLAADTELSELDEGERRFVAEAAQAPRLEAEVAARWSRDICARLDGLRGKNERGRVLARLKEAQARGDKAEAIRLLRLYESLGRSKAEGASRDFTEEG